MRGAAVDGVIGHVVRIQRTAVHLHMMVHLQLDEIRVSVGAVQRSDFPQGYVLEADMRRAALDGDKAVQAAVGITVDNQLSRPGNALNLRSGRLVDFACTVGQIDINVRAQKPVVDRLHRVAQRAKVGVAGTRI